MKKCSFPGRFCLSQDSYLEPPLLPRMFVLYPISPVSAENSLALHKDAVCHVVKRLITFDNLALSTLVPKFFLYFQCFYNIFPFENRQLDHNVLWLTFSTCFSLIRYKQSAACRMRPNENSTACYNSVFRQLTGRIVPADTPSLGVPVEKQSVCESFSKEFIKWTMSKHSIVFRLHILINNCLQFFLKL